MSLRHCAREEAGCGPKEQVRPELEAGGCECNLDADGHRLVFAAREQAEGGLPPSGFVYIASQLALRESGGPVNSKVGRWAPPSASETCSPLPG